MIKVEITGVSGIAQRGHIPSCGKVDGVEIVALSDSNKKKVEDVVRKSKYRILFYRLQEFIGIKRN